MCAAAVFLHGRALAQDQTPSALPVFGLQFSPDGALLAAASNSADPPGSIAIWNTSDWSVYRVHRTSGGNLDLDFSRDGAQLAYATKAGVVGVLEVPTGKVLREIDAHSGAAFSVAFAPDGRSVVSAGADHLVKRWNAESGALVRSFEGHSDAVYGVAVSPDGKTLLSGGTDQEARLWNLETGELKQTFKPSDLIVRRVTFSHDGEYFLTSRWDGKVRIRETTTGQLRALLSSGSDCADMTADNRFVVTSGQGSTAEVFALDLRKATADQRRRIAEFIQHFLDDSYEVREAAAEEIVAIGLAAEPQLRDAMQHDDAEVRVRARRLRERVMSPKPIAALPGHSGDVEVVCFARDSRLLATACRGGDIKVWNASSYRELATLHALPADGEQAK